MQTRQVTISWSAFFVSLLGLLWCGYVVFPSTGATCTTSGCAVFQDIKIAGVSLWWAGIGYFFILALLCIRGKLMPAWWLAKTGLAADTLLLALMFFYAPCLDCLIVAIFIALSAFCLRPSPHGWFLEGERVRLFLLPIWFGLFLGNGALVLNEKLPLWQIGKPAAHSVQLFFSPSCPSCRDALLALGHSARLLPVQETAEDFAAIIKLEKLLQTDVSLEDAVARCRIEEEPLPAISTYESILLHMKLLRNKAALFKQGFSSLPLIQINGMPKNWLTDKAKPRGNPAEAGQQSSLPHSSILPAEPAFGDGLPRTGASENPDLLPWEIEEPEQCFGDTSVPCPE